MTELNASGANGLMDALGVKDYEIGLLSGGISGTRGLDYQFSYNSSIKAQLPLLDLALVRLDGSVEYRPTDFDGGAIRVTGSLKLPIVPPELVVRRTLDLESDNVTRDRGLSIALNRSKLFVGTFGDEDTELGFVASLSIESKSFPLRRCSRRNRQVLAMMQEAVLTPGKGVVKGFP
jgi:hypothetical protein